MFIMYSFEGEYRRKPVQSLGGASKHTQRDSFLQHTQLERQKREELRHQVHSAIKIQAYYRGYRTRLLQKHKQRCEFDSLQVKTNQTTEELATLISKICFFFDKSKDSSKLVWLSQSIIKNSANFMKLCQKETSFAYSIAQYLSLTLSFLSESLNESSLESKASQWRLLETFLNINNWKQSIGNDSIGFVLVFVLKLLVLKGYFEKLRVIVDSKVPPLLGPTTRAPNPISACLLDFIALPLEFSSSGVDDKLRNSIVNSFSSGFLRKAYSDPVANFILPSLKEKNAIIPLFNLLETNKIEKGNPWLLHSLLLLCNRHPGLNNQTITMFLDVISQQSECLQFMETEKMNFEEDDSDDEKQAIRIFNTSEQEIMSKSVEILNDPVCVQTFVSSLQIQNSIRYLSTVGHNLLLSDKMALHKYRLLYTLAFKPSFLQQLWFYIKSEKSSSLFESSDTSLIQLLAKGVHLTVPETQRMVPVLDVFCSLFSHLLVTLDDSEFYNDSGEAGTAMPFNLNQVVDLASTLRDVCLGLVEQAFPESRPNASLGFSKVLSSTVGNTENDTRVWMHLFKSTVNFVRQLHIRDTRRTFCPSWVWVTNRATLPVERNGQLPLRSQSRQVRRPFRAARPMTRKEIEEEGSTMLSTREIRTLAILREIPFVFSFTDRVKLWQQWIMIDRSAQQTEANFLRGPSIHVMVRRNYIYEDAFDKLSLENEPNLRLKMRVQLTNVVGLDEAGVDGGGIFREFLSELLKTSFDPNRGFFRLTHDNLLYPNPGVAVLIPDFPKHYFFIGRMLGKALYENLLVELPMADFFLSKILGQASASLDVHNLASLDPVLHKNLLYLRHYEGDVADLGLDFTIVSSELGETRVEELKPNGANIQVTSSNRIEYIHLVADYKLNKQIRLQCNAFRQGLANVIDLEWLQTFSYRELQILVSGAYTPVDLEDLKRHTHYTGGYTSTHPVIQAFWRVVSQFDDSEKRHLLKFVTSCSRPPLLGFKDLDPPFCIQNAGKEDRLPTASTCMNLLKLPEFHDENVLRERLVYALQSGAGFELS